jgi:hypothetical protein
MWQAILAAFKVWIGINKVVEKALPSEKIQEAKFEVKKPTLEIGERIKRQNKIFNKIKNVPDADVKSFVLEFTDMNEEDTEIMVKNITVRIAEYRRDFPIISGWRRFTKNK